MSSEAWENVENKTLEQLIVQTGKQNTTGRISVYK